MGLKLQSKYRAKRTVCGYLHTHPSKSEAGRCTELHMRLEAKDISNLQLQPRYPLVVNGQHICDYVADWSYVTKAGEVIVEDRKGVKTPVYSIKKKLLAALWNIDIYET